MMVNATGKRICDKEIWSRKRNMWVGCCKPANVIVSSRWVCSGLDYCEKHAPKLDAV